MVNKIYQYRTIASTPLSPHRRQCRGYSLLLALPWLRSELFQDPQGMELKLFSLELFLFIQNCPHTSSPKDWDLALSVYSFGKLLVVPRNTTPELSLGRAGRKTCGVVQVRPTAVMQYSSEKRALMSLTLWSCGVLVIFVLIREHHVDDVFGHLGWRRGGS